MSQEIINHLTRGKVGLVINICSLQFLKALVLPKICKCRHRVFKEKTYITVVHFMTARRLVLPSWTLFSLRYCPAPFTFTSLALICKDSSAGISSKLLTSCLLFTTWYLKENLLIFIDLGGLSLLDDMSARALSVSLSNVLPRHKVGEMWAGMYIISGR